MKFSDKALIAALIAIWCLIAVAGWSAVLKKANTPLPCEQVQR